MVELWRPEDREGAISTVREVFDEYAFTWDEDSYHADLYDVPASYLNLGNPFFVANVDGQVVGTVALELFPTVAGSPGHVLELQDKMRVAGCDCSLERLYVRPSARRGGVGRDLMQRVVDEAHSRGCRAMEIWSDKRFEDAHRLYGRFGAIVVGDRICDDPDLSPEWGLFLDLS